jgi:hypothetical protein
MVCNPSKENRIFFPLPMGNRTLQVIAVSFAATEVMRGLPNQKIDDA